MEQCFQFFQKILQKLISRLRIKWTKIFIQWKKYEITDKEFLRAATSHFKNIQCLLLHIDDPKNSHFFLEQDCIQEYLTTLRKVNPKAESLILAEADKICDHVFDLLGSNPINLGASINWHRDFKSGYLFNKNDFYSDVKPALPPGGYDIKVPWELSRCQHLPRLGQAYWISNDEKYAIEFKKQVENWIENNSYPFGVNWACTMDVALRVVNWFWGYAFFRKSTMLDNNFRLVFYKSLLTHGRHIINNLEWSYKFTSNHYLSNLVGLIYCGFLLPEFHEAHIWRNIGLTELEHEMEKQVYPDGMDYESSTSYHRLSTELFLSATLLAEINGYSFSKKYYDRLDHMIENIMEISNPNGTVPIIGDQDNGRVHRLKVWDPPEREWNDFRHLLAVGAVWKNNYSWAASVGDCWDEAIWFFGSKVKKIFDQQSLVPLKNTLLSTCIPNCGLFIIRNNNYHIVIDFGPNGQNGFGGHAHNDTLSFDLSINGYSWIVDPGTYLYTQDYQARNKFRSTNIHNTVSINGYEQNLFNPDKLFEMGEENVPKIKKWEVNDLYTLLSGELHYPMQKPAIHKRAFYLDNKSNIFLLSDCVCEIEGSRQITFLFSPDVKIVEMTNLGSDILLENKENKKIWVHNLNRKNCKVTPQSGYISPSYGKICPCVSLLFDWSGDAINYIAFHPFEDNDDLPAKMNEIQRIRSVCEQQIKFIEH